MATLSPTTRWEIHNISGVRGELWAEGGTVQGMGGNLSDCRLPGPGTPGGEIGVPLPCLGLSSEGVPGTLLPLGWAVFGLAVTACQELSVHLCVYTPPFHAWALLRVCVPIWLLLSLRVSGPG